MMEEETDGCVYVCVCRYYIYLIISGNFFLFDFLTHFTTEVSQSFVILINFFFGFSASFSNVYTENEKVKKRTQ
jgi:hypothetical protein